MLLDGSLDATLMYLANNNPVDRSRARLEGDPRVRPLFIDAEAEGQRYFEKTGFFPINHGMVLRRSLHEQHPWLALNIVNAFEQAKQRLLGRVRELADDQVMLGRISPEARTELVKDIYPYGVRSNRAVLEAVARYSHEQGLTPRVVALEEIFAPSTLSL
jgi:4,5-dihydroxyphthalate decarboxylase